MIRFCWTGNHHERRKAMTDMELEWAARELHRIYPDEPIERHKLDALITLTAAEGARREEVRQQIKRVPVFLAE
jgi:hypothetical protein